MRFSVSHLVGTSGVQQVGTDSNLVSVLGLRSLSKSQGIPRPAATCLGLMDPWWVRVSGSHQDKASRVNQAKTKQALAAWRVSSIQENGHR